MSFVRLSQRLSVKHICLSHVFHKNTMKIMLLGLLLATSWLPLVAASCSWPLLAASWLRLGCSWLLPAIPGQWKPRFYLLFCERRLKDICVLLKDVVKDVRKTLCFTERCWIPYQNWRPSLFWILNLTSFSKTQCLSYVFHNVFQ